MVTLASLAKGNALSGTVIPGDALGVPINSGCVLLIQIAEPKSKIAISDWWIEVSYFPGVLLKSTGTVSLQVMIWD